MLKIENTLNSSFDVLLENIFHKTEDPKSSDSSQILDNLGDYIEFYKEKRKLEIKRDRLDEELTVKNAIINDLKAEICKLHNKELRLKKDAERANLENEKKTLELAKTTHEIRTPISGILGVTQLLLDSNLSKEQEKLIKTIETGSNSLLSLVNDILDHSKIKSGKFKFEQAPVNIRIIIEDVVEILRFKAQEKGVKLHHLISEDIPELVVGDPQRVRQILLNLAGNAVKFTDEGKVTIHASLIDQSSERTVVKFEITDTGIGIEEDKLSHLFKAFSQVSDSISKRQTGTGLGLAISKELTEKMGGEIGVASEKGRGATFWFIIPFHTHAVEAAQPSIKIADTNHTGLLRSIKNHQTSFNRSGIRILMAEDDPINAKVNSLILSKCGYSVDTVENGNEALNLLKKNTYDLVLMDIQMPDMSGLEAAKNIRNDRRKLFNSNIPIIAMTASTIDEDRAECLNAGMNDYITKPIDIEEIALKIERHLFSASQNVSAIAPENSVASSSGPLHLDDLKQLQSVMDYEFTSFIQLFLDRLPGRTAKIKAALRNRRYSQLKAAAHKLKGSASNFGAHNLIDICRRLEELNSSEMDAFETTIISQLETEVESVAKALNSIKANSRI